MTITLEVPYRTPSLNKTKRQHWALQKREREKAWDALMSALISCAHDSLIPTTHSEVLKICSMAYEELGSYRTTVRKSYGLRYRRRR
jgi:hypothetical protein